MLTGGISALLVRPEPARPLQPLLEAHALLLVQHLADGVDGAGDDLPHHLRRRAHLLLDGERAVDDLVDDHLHVRPHWLESAARAPAALARAAAKPAAPPIM